MLPSITPALPAIAFSKNTLYLKVQSLDYLSSNPAYAVNYIQFGAAVAAGTVFTLTWGIAGVALTAVADPDESGNEIPTGDGGSDYVTALVEWFQGNSFINQAYVVSADLTGPNPRLIFTAKAYGTDFTFVPANPPLGVITPGADNTPLINFAHHIEIWVGNDAQNGYDLAFTANVPLDFPLTGTTSVDIHETLHSMLSSDMPVLNALYAQCLNTVRPYYIVFGKYLGVTPAIQKVQNSSVYYVAKGGLGVQAAIKRNIYTELCPVANTPAQNRFMRQGSVNKYVTQQQPEWLTYINLSGAAIASASLAIIVYYNDGNSVNFNAVTGVAIGVFQKFQFQVGYSQLGIGNKVPGKTVNYYTARLVSAGAFITQEYAFVVDNNYREWPRYFVYENSYGAFQTIGTIGKAQPEYDRNVTQVELSVDRITAASIGELMEVNITFQDKNTVNIGYERSDERITELLRDLVASHRIFLYDNGTLIPVGLTLTNIKDAPDGANIYASQIQYYPLYLEEVYTEDPSKVTDADIDTLLGNSGSIIPAAALAGFNAIVDDDDNANNDFYTDL